MSEKPKSWRINPEWVALEDKPHLKVLLNANSYKPVGCFPPTDQIEATVAGVFSEARKQALEAGLSVMESVDGVIYEVSPNGSRRFVKVIEPSVGDVSGRKITIK